MNCPPIQQAHDFFTTHNWKKPVAIAALVVLVAIGIFAYLCMGEHFPPAFIGGKFWAFNVMTGCALGGMGLFFLIWKKL